MNKRNIIITVLVVLVVGGIAFLAVKKGSPDGFHFSSEPKTPVADIAVGALPTTVVPSAAQEALRNTIIAQFGSDFATSTVTIRVSADKKKFVVYKDNSELVTLPWDAASTRRVSILGQIGSHLYVGEYPESYNGYMVHGLGAFELAQIDVNKKKITTLKGTGDEFVYAVAERSTSRTDLAVINFIKHELRIFSTDKKINTTVALPVSFTQFGDVYFSPDGKTIAISAAFGAPGGERGAAFSTPVDKAFLNEVSETSKRDSFIRVSGWKGSSVDYTEMSAPQLKY